MTLLLVIVAAVAAFPLEADAAGKRPRAAIESVTPLSGQTMMVQLLVMDLESRDLPLRIEYRSKGTKGWQPATIETDLSAVGSSPEGVVFAAVWNAWDDLGTRFNRKTRLRTIVDVEKGKKKKSKRFEVVLFAAATEDTLTAILYPDLLDNSQLDDLVLIDVRSEDDFAAATIPGARHMSAEDILEDGKHVLDFPKDTRLVFFCYGGL